MRKTQLDVLQELEKRAEEAFGKLRAKELRGDLEQVSAELFNVLSFTIQTDDEP
jgi:hypothetical protein